jgi:lysozyme
MNTVELMKELMLDEGYKQEIYADPLGHLTFGVGHLITENDEEYGKEVGTPVTKERIEECLQQDIKTVFSELDMNQPWWRSLDSNRQRVIANMCFNLGHPRFSKFKKFIAAMQTSNWEKAAEEMMDSKWSTQVGERAIRLRDRVLNADK